MIYVVIENQYRDAPWAKNRYPPSKEVVGVFSSAALAQAHVHGLEENNYLPSGVCQITYDIDTHTLDVLGA
tara:strand:- start:156 stop:368 length:213 start_codon:yes stop_codon:yes gene_type:complete